MIVETVNRYYYKGPIFKNGNIYRLLNEPLWVEATSESDAYTQLIFRVIHTFGKGCSINRGVIHMDVKPIDYDNMFTNLNQVIEHFETQEESEPAPVVEKKTRKKKTEVVTETTEEEVPNETE